MAYANRYKVEYNDKANRFTQVFILEDNYLGSVIEKKASVSPFVLSLDGNDIFSPIKAQSAVINLLCEVDYEYLDLFTSDWQKFKIEVYKDSTIYWTGFILPDQYQESMQEAPYIIELSCSDGLSILKQIDFINELIPYNGYKTLAEVIQICLNKIQSTLNINEYVFLDITGITKTTDSLFTKIYINTASLITGTDTTNIEAIQRKNRIQVDVDNVRTLYVTNTCYEVLSYCLDIFGCDIIQSGGEWWIRQINALNYAGHEYAKYDNTFTYIETVTDEIIKQTNRPTTTAVNRYVFKGNNLLIKPAYKTVNIKQNLKVLEALNPTYDFIGNAGSDFLDSYYISQYIPDPSALAGLGDAGNEYSIKYNTDSDGTTYIAIRGNKGYKSIMFQIYIPEYTYTIAQTSLQKIKFSMRYRIKPLYLNQATSNEVLFPAFFYLKIGSKYAKYTPANDTCVWVNGTHEMSLEYNGLDNGWQIYEFTTDDILGISGIVDFKLRTDTEIIELPIGDITYHFEIDIDYIKIQLVDEEGEKFKGSRDYIINNEKNSKNQFKKEINFGSLPSFNNIRYIYSNGLYLDNDGSTPLVNGGNFFFNKTYGKTDLTAHLLDELNLQYQTPQQNTEGEVFGIIKPHEPVQDIYNLSKRFLLTRFSYDDRANKSDVSFTEIVNPVQCDYINQNAWDSLSLTGGTFRTITKGNYPVYVGNYNTTLEDFAAQIISLTGCGKCKEAEEIVSFIYNRKKTGGVFDYWNNFYINSNPTTGDDTIRAEGTAMLCYAVAYLSNKTGTKYNLAEELIDVLYNTLNTCGLPNYGTGYYTDLNVYVNAQIEKVTMPGAFYYYLALLELNSAGYGTGYGVEATVAAQAIYDNFYQAGSYPVYNYIDDSGAGVYIDSTPQNVLIDLIYFYLYTLISNNSNVNKTNLLSIIETYYKTGKVNGNGYIDNSAAYIDSIQTILMAIAYGLAGNNRKYTLLFELGKYQDKDGAFFYNYDNLYLSLYESSLDDNAKVYHESKSNISAMLWLIATNAAYSDVFRINYEGDVIGNYLIAQNDDYIVQQNGFKIILNGW